MRRHGLRGRWPRTLAGWLGGAFAAACSPAAPSDAEALPLSPASPPRDCLALSHPLLFHRTQQPRSALTLFDPVTGDGRLVATDGHFHGSAWAPDGRSIAYRFRDLTQVRGDTVESVLGLIAPDGSERLELWRDRAPAVDGLNVRLPDGPSWSPDGRQLAFASRRGADHWRIWLLSRSGGNARLLRPDLAIPHFFAAWSPRDAATLAFVGEVAGRADLFLVDPSGDDPPHDLSRGRLRALESPRWSPDGTRIALSAEPAAPFPDSVRSGISAQPALLPPDADARRFARSAEPSPPQPSPAAGLVVSVDEAPSPALGARDVYIVDVAEERWVHLPQEGDESQVTWSPDGQSLLVASNRPRSEGPARPPSTLGYDLWRVPLDGAPAQPLTRQGQSSSGPDWYAGAACAEPGD